MILVLLLSTCDHARSVKSAASSLGVLATIAWVFVLKGQSILIFDLAFGHITQGQRAAKELRPRSGRGYVGFAIYSYFGYYNICYLGGEVAAARANNTDALNSGEFLDAVVVLFTLVHIAIVSVGSLA